MNRWTLAAVVVGGIIAVLGGCAGTGCSDNPAAPGCVTGDPPPPPTLHLTAVISTLRVEATFAFAGTAEHHDGSPTVPINQWSSDNAQVVAVDSSGKATGVGNGTATVMGEHDGVRAPSSLRVVPDYQGSWAGDYQTSSCHESGDFVGFCREFPVGAMLPVSLQLSQPDVAVDGTFSLGELSASVHGTIDDSGSLSFRDAEIGVQGVTVKLTATALSVRRGDELDGILRTVWTRRGAAGEAGYEARLRLVIRVAATSRALSPRTISTHTWRELIPTLRAR